MDCSIDYVHAREILDSRGRPTVEVEIGSRAGRLGRASVPSGASTGSYEAVELRDGDASYFSGLGVGRAIQNIRETIAPKIMGLDCMDQAFVDNVLLDLDASKQKSRLGANATLGVSLALSRLAAEHAQLPLYRYLGGVGAIELPVPFVNVINGGSHAHDALDVQELMLVPLKANSFAHALRMSCEVFYKLGELLQQKHYSVNVGDEGGYAPSLTSIDDAFAFLARAVEKAGYKVGEDIYFACDIAATELYHSKKKRYLWKREKKDLSSKKMVEFLADLTKKYPIISLEDGLAEDDWKGFSALMHAIGEKVQVVGDDLTVTNVMRLKKAIKLSAINTILIKPNQIGTLSETLRCIKLAQAHGFGVMVSHRSGETEDPYIADLAVGVGSGQIKTGSVSRSDRISKYNRLLRIEEELGEAASYGRWFQENSLAFES